MRKAILLFALLATLTGHGQIGLPGIRIIGQRPGIGAGGVTGNGSTSIGTPAGALLNNATGAILLNNATGATLLNNAP